ncbi:hypothetical protein [Spiroplasma endosymbiont of Nomada rufipes]|uniref:hypothetical protein n=1 Tax=Spiroplasma endosymbiont of Nomada rufipes TaxID=3077933 RepID=UPI00376F37F8
MKFLYENFLQFYLLALTSIIQHKEIERREKMPQEEELLINNDIDSNIEANTINNSWSSLIWSDTKKIIGTASLLTAAVGLKTVQRVFQVAVTSIGSFDWNKVNPLNNLVDFGVTPVQLVISTQAMNLWKWGAEKIWQEGRTIFNRTADQ